MSPTRGLGLLVTVSLLMAACGGATVSTTTTTLQPAQETTTMAAPAETTTTDAAATTTTAAGGDGEMEAAVHVSETQVGEILVDPEGFTLYIFTVDSEGESACYDACAELWPPVDAATPIGDQLDPSMFGSTTRTDGTEQLTVNGMPLYLYTPDTSPGDLNGQGFNDVWFVVDAQGNVIEAAIEDAALDYGY